MYLSGKTKTGTELNRQSETEPVRQNPELFFNYSQAFGFKTSKVTTPVLVTCLTVTITTGTSSGLGSRTVGFFLHLGQLLSAWLPSLLVASMDTWSECTVNRSVFLWCFCFGETLTVFIVELCGLQSHFPLSCYDVLYHCAFYFTLFCLFASTIFTTNYVRFLPQSHTRNQAISATACSCISAVLYAAAGAWTCALAGDTSCFVPAGPGVLERLLIFLLYVILALIFSTIINCNSRFQYMSAMVRQTILCSICFYLGMMSTLLLEDNNETRTPVYYLYCKRRPCFHPPLYQHSDLWSLCPFHEKLGGLPLWSSDVSCHDKIEGKKKPSPALCASGMNAGLWLS